MFFLGTIFLHGIFLGRTFLSGIFIDGIFLNGIVLGRIFIVMCGNVNLLLGFVHSLVLVVDMVIW